MIHRDIVHPDYAMDRHPGTYPQRRHRTANDFQIQTEVARCRELIAQDAVLRQQAAAGKRRR